MSEDLPQLATVTLSVESWATVAGVLIAMANSIAQAGRRDDERHHAELVELVRIMGQQIAQQV